MQQEKNKLSARRTMICILGLIGPSMKSMTPIPVHTSLAIQMNIIPKMQNLRVAGALSYGGKEARSEPTALSVSSTDILMHLLFTSIGDLTVRRSINYIRPVNWKFAYYFDQFSCRGWKTPDEITKDVGPRSA